MGFGRIGGLFGSRSKQEDAPIAQPGTSSAEMPVDDAPTAAPMEEPPHAPESVDYAALLADSGVDFAAAFEEEPEEEVAEVPLASVDDLQEPVKLEAIRIAKKILDNLRLQFADMTLETVISAGDIPMIHTLMSGVSDVVDTFKHHYINATRLEPELVDDPVIHEAMDAMAIFNHYGLSQAIRQLELEMLVAQQQGDMQKLSELRIEADRKKRELEAMTSLPANAGDISITTLLNTMERGMDRVVERMQTVTQHTHVALGAPQFEQRLEQTQDAQREARENKHADQYQRGDDAGAKKDAKQQEHQVRKSEDNMKKFIRSDAAYDAMMAARRERQRRAALARKEEQVQRRANQKRGAGERQGLMRPKRDDEGTTQQRNKSADDTASGNAFDHLLSAASFDVPDIDVGAMEESEELMPNNPKRMVAGLLQKNKNAVVQSDVVADNRQRLKADAQHDVQEAQQNQDSAAIKRRNTQMGR